MGSKQTGKRLFIPALMIIDRKAKTNISRSPAKLFTSFMLLKFYSISGVNEEKLKKGGQENNLKQDTVLSTMGNQYLEQVKPLFTSFDDSWWFH